MTNELKKQKQLAQEHKNLRYYLNVEGISRTLEDSLTEIAESCTSLDKILATRVLILKKYEAVINKLDLKCVADLTGHNQLSSLTNLDRSISLLSEGFTRQLGLSESTSEKLDILSFRILDFIFVCGRERESVYNKLFGKWFTRSPQMLFKQKGELYILNFLHNFLQDYMLRFLDESIGKGDIKEFVKSYTKNYLYKDIAPYFLEERSLAEQEVEVEKSRQRLMNIGRVIGNKRSDAKPSFSKKGILERTVGFELEHQVRYTGEQDYKTMSEAERNKWIKETLYSDSSKYPIIARVQAGLFGDGLDVLHNGTLTRDASNAQLVTRDAVYFPCEYSSPVAKNYVELGQNIAELCAILRENNGVVREDTGVHVHVSIEDLLESPEDSPEVKYEKLEAFKRIFTNFVLLEDKIKEVLPECRRDGNSLYSSQSYKSFLNEDIELTLGLINSCQSYDEIREVLGVSGKYLSSMPFAKTVEFRTLQATTNPDVISKWAELVAKFVQNSIDNLPLEQCLDGNLLNELVSLTKNGTKIEGMREDDSQNICYPANDWDPLNFRTVPSSVITRNRQEISAQEVQDNCIEYAQSLGTNLQSIGGKYHTAYKMPNDVTECRIGQGINRRPGEYELAEDEEVERNVFVQRVLEKYVKSDSPTSVYCIE